MKTERDLHFTILRARQNVYDLVESLAEQATVERLKQVSHIWLSISSKFGWVQRDMNDRARHFRFNRINGGN